VRRLLHPGANQSTNQPQTHTTTDKQHAARPANLRTNQTNQSEGRRKPNKKNDHAYGSAANSTNKQTNEQTNKQTNKPSLRIRTHTLGEICAMLNVRMRKILQLCRKQLAKVSFIHLFSISNLKINE
jgi:hypothetical protein